MRKNLLAAAVSAAALFVATNAFACTTPSVPSPSISDCGTGGGLTLSNGTTMNNAAGVHGGLTTDFLVSTSNASVGGTFRNLGSDISRTFQDYGAVSGSSLDQSAAIKNALQSGLPITCTGTFHITSQVAVTLTSGQSLVVNGGGLQTCKIYEDAAAANVSITATNGNNPVGTTANSVEMTGVTLVPTTQLTVPALFIQGAVNNAGTVMPSFHLDRVNVLPSSTANYALDGIWFQDMRNGTLENSVIQGHQSSYTGVDGGVVFTSTGVNTGSGSAVYDLHMHDNIVAWYSKGLYLLPNRNGYTNVTAPNLLNDWEGIYVTDNTFLADDYGVHATNLDTESSLLVFKGNHINFNSVGIYAVSIENLLASDNYLLNGPVAGFIPAHSYGFLLDSPIGISVFDKIHDNNVDFQLSQSNITTRTGFYAHGSAVVTRYDLHDNSTLFATVPYDVNGTLASGTLNSTNGVDATSTNSNDQVNDTTNNAFFNSNQQY